MNQLTAESIYKSFGAKLILKDLSLNLLAEQKTLLLGPNGIGKTTLLKTLAGHLPLDSGNILINNAPVEKLGNKLRNHIVYIASRERGLYPHLNIRQNITLLARACNLNKDMVEQRVQLWRKIKVFDKALFVKFSHCSKGMKQIALLFCQTLHSPKIILLDEPFSGLDEENKKTIHEVIDELFKGSAILMATHDKSSDFFKSYKHLHLMDGQLAN